MPQLPPRPPGSSLLTGLRVTLLQVIVALVFVAGAAYQVGVVHAQLDAHEALPGHPATVAKVQAIEVTMASVAATLALLQKRPAIRHPGG